MIPPFAVSFSSSLRTRTRSCRGVIFTVISLTSVQSIPKREQSTSCGSRPTLRAKNLPILLPRHFHVVRGEPFRGGLIVGHRNLVELAVVEGEKNLFDSIRLERNPGKVRRPPSQFLYQRWTSMSHLHISHLLVSTLQHSGQADSKGK